MDIYHSKIAKIAAFITLNNRWAITTRKDRTLYSCGIQDVNDKWRAHEEIHKDQIAELGRWKFYFEYFIEFLKHGYKNNKFEKEARGENYVERSE